VQCGIVSFTVEGTASEAVQAALAQRGINIACSFARAALVEGRRGPLWLGTYGVTIIPKPRPEITVSDDLITVDRG